MLIYLNVVFLTVIYTQFTEKLEHHTYELLKAGNSINNFHSTIKLFNVHSELK